MQNRGSTVLLLRPCALAVVALCACINHAALAPLQGSDEPRCIGETKTAIDGETLVLSLADFFAPSEPVAPYELDRELAVQGDGQSLVPRSLRSAASSLSGSQRARLLQLAVHIANHIQRTDGGTPKVRVVVPGTCSFDFSHHQGETVADEPDSKPFDTHPDADTFHASMHPKLFIGRGNVTIEGESHGTPPELWYAGPGVEGRGHGRVIVLARSGLANVRLAHLKIRGDHSWMHARDLAYYLHEGARGLDAGNLDRRSWYGAIMVGLGGGRNDVTLEDIDIAGVNRAGIAVVGNANLNHVSVTGILPDQADRNTAQILFEIHTLVSNEIPDTGYGFDTGLAQQGAYGRISVTDSSFSRVVEGITGGGLGTAHWWDVRRNRFTKIGDHGIYILGRVWTSSFTGNHFNQVLGAALKFGDSCDLPPWTPTAEPASSEDSAGSKGTPCGAHHVTVASNKFELLRREALILSGTFNVVSNNEILPYSRPLDITSDKTYDPRSGASTLARPNVMPDVWLGTDGGQSGYANHAAFNDFVGNSKGGEGFTIFITQHPSTLDRSVAFNRIQGHGQVVYFNTSTDSSYAPAIVVEGADLRMGAPQDCSDCQPGRPDYRLSLSDIAVQPAFSRPLAAALNGRSVPQVFVRFGAGRDMFVVGENGMHRRIGATRSTVSIHAIADLDGDGSDELYYGDGSGVLRGRRLGVPDLGARAAGTPLELAPGSWQYASSVPAQAEVAHLLPSAPAQLATAFAGDPSIYGTRTTDGNPVRGPAIYTPPAGSQVRLLRAADLSAAGETKARTDELYVVLSRGRIVGLYRAADDWKSQEVYSGGQLVSFLEPARMRHTAGCRETEPRQRMYQGFGGSELFETAPPVGDVLPRFGRAPFYAGGDRWFSALAADLDGDGAQELIGLLGSPQDGLACAKLSCDANAAARWQLSSLRTGATNMSAICRVSTAAGDQLLTFSEGSRTVLLSEKLDAAAVDYFDWIRERMWAGDATSARSTP